MSILKLVVIVLLGALLFFIEPSLAMADGPTISKSDVKRVATIQKLAKRNKWAEIGKLTQKISHPVLKDVLIWQRLTARNSGASFSEIAAFIKAHPKWPGIALLQRRAEEAMTAQLSDQEIFDWFEKRDPLTVDGGIYLGQAYLNQKNITQATKFLRKAWVSGNFGAKQERYFYKRFRRYLTREDHIARLDRLLWQGSYYPVRRMYRRVNKSYRALAQARLTLRRKRGGVDRAIAKMPKEFLNHPGFLYERMRWRRRKGRDLQAREILDNSPPDLVRPDLWWREVSVLARRAIQDGHFSEAYRMAKNHKMTKGVGFVEGEWLAGWIALRFLKDTKVAYGHFTELYRIAKYPISLSRGAYWAARAAEELKDKKHARFWYKTAASYPITYYGQLAAAKIKKDQAIPFPLSPHLTAEETIAFQKNELVGVIKILAKAELQDLMRRFVRQLNAIGETPGWQSAVAKLAHQSGRPDLAIGTAKIAYRNGVNLIEEGFPLLSTDKNFTIESPLIHAVIRQESAFNRKAISHAGARGLMQLMPRTARKVAKNNAVPYVRRRLTEDTSYNLRLGAAYLGGLVKDFKGSYVLALSAYNAGPSRAKRWVKKYGDPRDPSVDAIDWVELIPFDETRNYVQRVMENLHVYRHRLNIVQLAFNPEGDLRR